MGGRKDHAFKATGLGSKGICGQWFEILAQVKGLS